MILAPENLGKLLHLSRGTYPLIENGKATSIDYYYLLANFYLLEISELLDPNKPILEEEVYRRKVLDYHIAHTSDPDLLKLLRNDPPLSLILDYRLINKGYFAEPREVNHVAEYIQSMWNVDYSKTISGALRRLYESNILNRRLINGKDYEYFIKAEG